MKKTVKELAQFLGGTVIGDENREISDVKGLAEAGSDDISFAVEPYTEYLPQVHAGAVITEKEYPAGDNTLVLVENPRLAFSKLLELFHPRQSVQKGIHSMAVVDESAKIGENTAVMAYAVIGKNGAVIMENTVMGDNAVIRAHAVIGGEGFGFATKDGKHTRIPQIGNVTIGDDVEIGACTTIDNGTLGSTKVGRGTKIDNLVHLGHNVEIGEDCFVIAQTGIAGSTKVGNHVIFAGQTGCTGHITIGDNVTFAGKSGIVGNVASNTVNAGFPARPHIEWSRTQVYIKKLPDLAKTVKALEKRIAELEEKK